MRWEELTCPDFEKAVKKSKGVCILPLGVIEKHGDHLPLGTDMFNVHSVACSAAEKEPAVVFPYYYFTQIYEAKHLAGTIAVRHDLMIDLLENVCDEIGRNGLKKIILLNGHGGNNNFVPYFVQTMLDKKKDYLVYYPANHLIRGDSEYRKLHMKIMETKEHAHGCECETSITLAVRPDLVKMEYLKGDGPALNRLNDLDGLYTPMYWYKDYPSHYAGDARPATEEKGTKLLELQIKYIIKIIRAVKTDTQALKLYNEFFLKTQSLQGK